MDVILGTAAFAPFPILAVVCWIFWRAKKRDDEQKES
jgi:hypothetical protein